MFTSPIGASAPVVASIENSPTVPLPKFATYAYLPVGSTVMLIGSEIGLTSAGLLVTCEVSVTVQAGASRLFVNTESEFDFGFAV